MSLLIKNVSLASGIYVKKGKPVDIVIEKNKILNIGDASIKFKAKKVISADGLIAIPGVVDLGVYLREPGYEYKATIASEIKAAVSAGMTRLVAMPHTDPIIDSPTVVELVQNRVKEVNLCNVSLVGALTKGLQGKELSEMSALKSEQCIAFSNLDRPFTSLSVMQRAFEYATGLDLPIFFHPQAHSLTQGGCAHDGRIAHHLGLKSIPVAAETTSLSQALAMAQDSGARVHFCRLSCGHSVELLRQAKKSGLQVSADVAIHQLLLTDTCLEDFDSNYHVIPPLRSEEDRVALLEGIDDGTIDAICSDHQPQDRGSKLQPFPSSAPGMSSLETFLPLLYRLVKDKQIKPAKALKAITSNPNAIIGISDRSLKKDAEADICLVNPDKIWKFEIGKLLSSGCNTPFIDEVFEGCVAYTICGGKVVYESKS